MCKYRVKQYLIVLKLDRVSINKVLVIKFVTVSFIQSKFDAKFANTVKLTTQWVRLFKSNRMFGTKHLKTI